MMQRSAALFVCSLFLAASACARHRDGGNPKTLAAALYALIAGSKFKDWTQFAGSPQGMICLQDHGDKAWFRDLKIRDLTPE